MTKADPPTTRLAPAAQARSVLAAGGSLAWFTNVDAGTTPYYDDGCGSPMLLVTDHVAHELLTAGSGRLQIDLHPHLGIIQLVGAFWPLAGYEAMATLDAVHRDHADCPGCNAWQLTQVIGVQVNEVAIRLPGEREFFLIPLNDYVLAGSDPMVAVGANIAAHLNAYHESDLMVMAARLLRTPIDGVVGACAGAIDAHGFELFVVDNTGGRLLQVPITTPPSDPERLPDAIHQAIAAVVAARDPDFY